LGLSQRQLALWVRGSRSALAELERVDHDSAGLRLALAAALDRLEARAAQEGEAT
jgi:hypothetical protein